MKVIALRGKSNTGKTTVSRKLAEILISNGASYKMYPNKIDKYLQGELSPLPKGIWPRVDFIMECSFKGKEIGLASVGDYSEYSMAMLTFWNKRGKDLIVLCCRSRGRAVNRIKEEKDYVFVKMEKMTEGENWQAYCLTKATEIFEKYIA